jgi:hypothetical protein
MRQKKTEKFLFADFENLPTFMERAKYPVSQLVIIFYPNATATNIIMYGSSNHNPNRDIEVASPPNDCISQIVWSPRANFIAASSWDNSVSILIMYYTPWSR